MEQRPLCAIIPTNGRKETSLVRSTNSLNRTLSRSPRGGGRNAGQSLAPHCKGGGGGAAKSWWTAQRMCVFVWLVAWGFVLTIDPGLKVAPGIQFLHMQEFIWFKEGREKKNWIYSVVRGALWWQLRRLTALFVMLSSPRSYSTKLQCCYQGWKWVDSPRSVLSHMCDISFSHSTPRSLLD